MNLREGYECMPGLIFSVFITKKKRTEIINRLAYESLLEEARKKYPGKTGLDVYDVSWVKVKLYPLGWEYKAAGRVEQITDTVLYLKQQDVLYIQGGSSMTLKRKIFISNVLVIALPLVVMFGVEAAVFGISGIDFSISPSESQQIINDWNEIGRGIRIEPILIAIGIFVVGMVNLFLRRIMIKHIMKPLDTLSFGVQQIGKNNLGFRLDYRSNDEFRTVCDTFNETASRLEAMVKERQKNEDNRKELIAGISHDLRTPLTSIKVSINGIRSGVAATEDMREKYLSIIENKTVDLEHIIDQLFLFSKLDMDEFPVNTQIVSYSAMIGDCIEELSEEYERRGLVIVASTLPEHIHIDIDPILFSRVLINIFENTIKYKTAEKGHIAISCTEIESSGGTKNVEITLADDGPGVAPESLEKLFDVFYRADQSRHDSSSGGTVHKKGSGLGLAISAKIVTKMGGAIRAELPAAGGLAIVITLPLVERQSPLVKKEITYAK
jgi:signal transduction histidine kinase